MECIGFTMKKRVPAYGRMRDHLVARIWAALLTPGAVLRVAPLQEYFAPRRVALRGQQVEQKEMVL